MEKTTFTKCLRMARWLFISNDKPGMLHLWPNGPLRQRLPELCERKKQKAKAKKRENRKESMMDQHIINMEKERKDEDTAQLLLTLHVWHPTSKTVDVES